MACWAVGSRVNGAVAVMVLMALLDKGLSSANEGRALLCEVGSQ